jgi:hypothetical protein
MNHCAVCDAVIEDGLYCENCETDNRFVVSKDED